MAKVGKVEHEVLGEKVTFAIHYRDGKFQTTYPDMIAERTQGRNTWYYRGNHYSAPLDTEILLLAEIKKYVDEVNNLAKEISYIIVYKLSTENEGRLQHSFSLQLTWAMFRQTKIGTKSRFHYVTKAFRLDTFEIPEDRQTPVPGYEVIGNEWEGRWRGNEANPEVHTSMPMTPENVAFFLSLETQLKELQERITTFLNLENIQKFIASNMPMQLVGKVEETAEAATAKEEADV